MEQSMKATLTVTPTIDWGNLLAVIPTEALEAELERRERHEGLGTQEESD